MLARLRRIALLASAVAVPALAQEAPPAASIDLGVLDMAPAGEEAADHRAAFRRPLVLDDDTLLVVEVRLSDFTLSEGVLAYEWDGAIFVPLAEFAHALGFEISSDAEAGTASGWFLRESRHFELSLSAGEVTSDGERHHIDDAEAAAGDGDIYVELSLLEVWFPLDLDYESAELAINVSSREPLPIEEQLAREERQAGLRRGSEAPRYPRAPDPYRMLEMPFADVSVRAERQGGGIDGGSVNYSAFLGADILAMSGSLSLVGDDEKHLSDARVMLERQDPDAKLLGPLRATGIAVGDVFSPQLNLAADSARGRGAILTNFPVERLAEFDRTTLRGELLAGWEVELYRNDVLIDFARSRSDGLYEFTDVALLSGLNIVRLVFYGPQGQRREETRRVFVGPGLVEPGDVHYRLAVSESGESVLGVAEAFGESTSSSDGLRASIEAEVGLTRRISAFASAITVPTVDGHRTYVDAGLRLALLGTYTSLQMSRNDEGGRAAQAATQFRAARINVYAEHNELDNYISERFDDSAEPIERLSELRLDTAIGGGDFPRLPLSVELTREERASGRLIREAAGRVAAGIGRLNASNTITWRRETDGGLNALETIEGDLLLSLRAGNVSLRADGIYEISPETELRSVLLTADYDMSERLLLRGSIEHALDTSATSFGLGLNWDLNDVALGLDATYADDGTWRIGASMSLSLGRGEGGELLVEREPLARSGAAAVFVFHDADSDGRYGEGDAPIEGAGFDGSRDGELTRANGTALLTGLPANRPTSIALDLSTLPDPYWQPAVPGLEIVPRPGHVTRLSFAVTPTGEIDGTVYLVRDGKEGPAGDAELQLVMPDGTIAQQTTSGFDGFYLFESVRPGRYAITLSGEQLARLGLVAPAPIEVEISPKGDVLSGRDIVLRPADAPAP